MVDNTVSIEAGGYIKTGWTKIDLTRGIETVPMSLELEVTEEYPTNDAVLPFGQGQPCVVKFGADIVLTGYIDRYYATINGSSHSVSISVRSKLQDSIDASAEFAGDASQTNWTTLADLATKLVTPAYGINVVDKAHVTQIIPAFRLQLGETSMDIIVRVARTQGTLVYDNEAGDMVLATVGAEGEHSSGFRQGEGVQSATINFGMDQRFSEYIVVHQSIDNTVNLLEPGTSQNVYGHSYDYDVPRNRKLYVVNEAPYGQIADIGAWGQMRADFEKNRRWGRGHAVELTCDSWRDSAGRLWTPNAFATVNAPAIHIINEHWIIASVRFTLDNDSGTTASLLMMPKEAFSIEPTVLFRLPGNLAPTSTGTPTGIPPT